MYQTASGLKTRSERAVMPGIIAIISALIFTFIFNYMVNYYMISPIVRITRATNLFKEKRIPFNVKIETRDEIHDLAQSIDQLCSSVIKGESRK
jgi:HAMP domain-containing protein